MFWKKDILIPTKKDKTLEDRIIDIMKLNSVKIKIENEKISTQFTYPYNCRYSPILITILYNSKSYFVSCTHDYKDQFHQFFIITDTGEGIELNSRVDILGVAERVVKDNFTKMLFPINPEIEEMMSGVYEIQEGKEQIDFILKKMQTIKESISKQ